MTHESSSPHTSGERQRGGPLYEAYTDEDKEGNTGASERRRSRARTGHLGMISSSSMVEDRWTVASAVKSGRLVVVMALALAVIPVGKGATTPKTTNRGLGGILAWGLNGNAQLQVQRQPGSPPGRLLIRHGLVPGSA